MTFFNIFFQAIFSLLKQPLFYLAILFMLGMNYFRIRKERRLFRVAINSSHYPLKIFFSGILGGLVLSGILLLLGVAIPYNWVFFYGIVAVLMLFTFAKNGLSLLTMPLTSGVYFLYFFFGNHFALKSLFSHSPLSAQSGISLFLLSGLVCLIAAGYLYFSQTSNFSPRLKKSPRGKTFAYYKQRQWWFFPTLILVPGTGFISHSTWWPVLNLGSYRFSIMILPIVLGYGFDIMNKRLRLGMEMESLHYLIFALSQFIFAVLCYFFPTSFFLFTLLSILIGLGVVLQSYHYHRKGHLLYTKVNEGLRIIAVRPKTPASKMDLEVGDIIMTCNGENVFDNAAFYRAIQKNPTFCKLRVRTLSGEYKMTETAIFADAPHELGIVTFND